MSVKTLTIDDHPVSVPEGTTLLAAAAEAGVSIPTLCHLAGIEDVGACRMCLVEVEGTPKLLPACATVAREGMVVRTDTERLRNYRRMALELLFAERNHVCAVCVANGHCELQTLAYNQGMEHVRYDYCHPQWSMDLSHPLFGMDHNRCILCTRCVRVCWNVEGAGTKNLAGRGATSHIIHCMNTPWGETESCTSCGKCVQACPTGALFHIGATAAEMERDPTRIANLVKAREIKEWTV